MDSATTESGLRTVDNILKHVSEQPWSNYTAADYSVEQWHAACLIHMHDGAPTSKGECKLPVKTPSGVVNKNGVHSAAAALAGARGGVNASAEQKSSAAKSLVRLYHQMDEEPPPSLLKHSSIDDIIQHFGVRGMRWGVRKKPSPRPSFIGKDGKPKKKSKEDTSEDASRARELKVRAKSGGTKALTNKELKDLVERMNLEQQYVNITAKNKKTVVGQKFAQDVVTSIAKQSVSFAANAVIQKQVGDFLSSKGLK